MASHMAHPTRSVPSIAIGKLSRVSWRLPPSAEAVAISFDDGPDPVFTPLVLDVLAWHGACATFFCVGRRLRQHPSILRRMIEESHAVGSHSETHRDAWTLSLPDLARDYRDGRLAIEEALGRSSRLFRPPKGQLDGRGALTMRAAGVSPWMWSVNPEDWRPGGPGKRHREVGVRSRSRRRRAPARRHRAAGCP